MNNILQSFELIGDFSLNNNNNKQNLIKLNINPSVSKKTMSSKLGRVYIFKEIKSNGDVEILKIGKSSDKSGLNGTLGFYINALSGTSGTNRFCLHYLIYDKLISGSRIEIYIRFAESIKTKISGLLSEVEIEIPLDITYIEQLCMTDYKSIFNKYPIWNFQESSIQYPIELLEKYTLYRDNINKRRKTKLD